MKAINQYIEYLALRFAILILRVTPRQWSKAAIARALTIVSYRQEVITSNLRASFPSWTEKEILQINKSFYSHLAEITVDQLLSDSKKLISYTGIDKINVLIEDFDGIILLGAHYGDWEATGKQITPLIHKKASQYVAYKRLKNKHLNSYMKQLRSDTVATPIDNKQLAKIIISNIQKKQKSAYYLIADQYPSSLQKIENVRFLNQDTLFINGPMKLAKKYNLPVAYLAWSEDLNGVNVEIKIIYNPKEDNTRKDIITKYAEALEEQINHNPSQWLWSHKRWKNIR